MRFDLKDNVITLYFEGELNSYNAGNIDKEIEEDFKVQKYTSISLNFEKLSYISSAGLRIILKLKQKFKDVSIVDATLEVFDISWLILIRN